MDENNVNKDKNYEGTIRHNKRKLLGFYATGERWVGVRKGWTGVALRMIDRAHRGEGYRLQSNTNESAISQRKGVLGRTRVIE